ncbi:zinc transporter ZIP10 [Hoplias malabaricus]|uniref:zinc transporter ZIP10 n=1 Tax=Hoplias malabaricus TaxID=27720 RepID=UPI00346365E9
MMRVHAHTKFCFLCVLTVLFHQCTHCHDGGHHHHHDHDHEHDHDHVHSDLQISKASYISQTDHSAPNSQSEAAKNEQQYYIQQLFHRYGQKDRLDFRGFQSLLLSLGLGEVRVVGLEHDDLGHDHVAHLDLLEVQEGLHSHSPNHAHSHPHSKTHSHQEHHHHAHGEANGDQPTAHGPCSPSFTAGARPTIDSGPYGRKSHDLDKVSVHDHDHDYDHDHHEHEHAHETEQHNTQTQSIDRDQTYDNHEHSHGQLHDHEQVDDIPKQIESTSHHEHDHDQTQENNDLGQDHNPGTTLESAHTHSHEVSKTQPHHHHDHHHHKHPHPHNHHHHTADTTDHLNPMQPTQTPPQLPGSLHSSSPTQPPTAKPKSARRPGKGRGQRNRNQTPNTFTPTVSAEVEDGRTEHDHDHKHDDHMHSHSHKRKREVPEEMTSPNMSSLIGHVEDGPHQHEECLNLTQLLRHYGLSPDSVISPAEFTYLCPALLYQIDSRVCIRHYHQVDVQNEPEKSVWIWVWGFVSITVISLLSLLGVVLVPILNQSCFKYLLTFLVALAVGTLSGDALLHLLPHSQGGHDHSHGEQNGEAEETDLLTEFDGVWKGLTALAGIYLLFIIEHCISMFKHYKDQGGSFFRRKKRGEDGKIGRKLSDHKLNRRSDAEWMHLKPLNEGSQNDSQLNELQPLDFSNKNPLDISETQDSHQETAVTVTENGRKAKTKKHGHGHSHGHSHHGHCHTDKEMKDAGIASIAWMVIMGDGMHNFSDGLAIGAAFSANITGGISTSVAVFCHELPHELGDFAVLLKAGMSVKQAIVYNLLSALMAYFGMLIGTAVGQYTHNVTSWIFAITAGMFLYVALVDMLPEMLHGDSEDHKRCHLGHFVLQNLGMLTGFTIMLLIAIFEDHIVLDFDF